MKFNPGDKIEIVGHSDMFDGPGTVTYFNDDIDIVQVKLDHGLTGAFDSSHVFLRFVAPETGSYEPTARESPKLGYQYHFKAVSAEHVETKLNQLDDEGYEIVDVRPRNSAITESFYIFARRAVE